MPRKRATKAQKKVGKVMHEFKHGELHAGSKKGKKVTNPKQAIAIGLSEARRSGANVPPKKGRKKTTKKAASKKSTSKKSGSKKSTSKKSTSKKTSRKSSKR